MGAENLADLGQFAVQAPLPGQQQRPSAPKAQRFMAFLIDSFTYGLCSALSTAILTRAFQGDKLTLLIWSMFVLPVIYFVLPLYNSGQTPGKRFMKIQVINQDGTEDIGMRQAILREGPGRFVSIMCLGLGYISILTDGESRGWHDKMAKTRVIWLKDSAH